MIQLTPQQLAKTKLNLGCGSYPDPEALNVGCLWRGRGGILPARKVALTTVGEPFEEAGQRSPRFRAGRIVGGSALYNRCHTGETVRRRAARRDGAAAKFGSS